MISFLRARGVVLGLLLLGLAGTIQACNTVEGAGQDIQKAGKGIEKSADRNK